MPNFVAAFPVIPLMKILFTLMQITIGVLALQGAFLEHLVLLQQAAVYLQTGDKTENSANEFRFIEIRTEAQLAQCDALVIPGGESTTISLVAAQSGLFEHLRNFVKYGLPTQGVFGYKLIGVRVERKPTWGTCAGLILLAEEANRLKRNGQGLVGGLDVRVGRNHFGRQLESFQADLDLPFLNDLNMGTKPFPGVFIRSPIVEEVLCNAGKVRNDEQKVDGTVVASPIPPRKGAWAEPNGNVEIIGQLTSRSRGTKEQMGVEVAAKEDAGDIIAVRQGNVIGMSFHPELTTDIRIHVWWLKQVASVVRRC